MNCRSLCFFLALIGVSGVLHSSENWKYVGSLASDASRDESILTVDLVAPVAVDGSIMVERRDGELTEIHELQHVYDNQVVLKERLKSDFMAGSRVYQKVEP